MFDSVDGWQEFKDVIPNFSDTSIKSNSLLEHMNMTKAESDYLWYTSRYCHLFENMYHFLLNIIDGIRLCTLFVVHRFQHNPNCTNPMLHVESLGHLMHAFAGETYFGESCV